MMALAEDSTELQEYSWSLENMARYPFIDDSKRYIKNEGPPLEELIRDRLWSEVRRRGFERVIQAVKNGNIKDKSITKKSEQEIELFSYPVARILVSSIDDNYLIRRYALGEAEKFLRNLMRESSERVLDIGEEFEVEAKAVNDSITLYFASYLENTEHLKSPEWKLINQDLRDGEVYLSLEKFQRILKESYFLKIIEDLPRPVNTKLVDAFKNQIKRIEEILEETRAEFTEMDFGEVDTEKFPPCIKKLISLQREGANLSHEERFALTSFLHKVGFSEDEIISIFSESPDFNKEMARYQIEHITGIISGTEYTPPNCDTMKTNAICFDPDSLCDREWMTHPLKYYSVKMKQDKKE